MKKVIIRILKIFVILILLELLIGLISTSFGGVANNNSILGVLALFFNYLMHLLSYPLFLINNSYPYYAIMDLSKLLGLIFLNTLLQSIIIWLLFYRK